MPQVSPSPAIQSLSWALSCLYVANLHRCPKWTLVLHILAEFAAARVCSSYDLVWSTAQVRCCWSGASTSMILKRGRSFSWQRRRTMWRRSWGMRDLDPCTASWKARCNEKGDMGEITTGRFVSDMEVQIMDSFQAKVGWTALQRGSTLTKTTSQFFVWALMSRRTAHWEHGFEARARWIEEVIFQIGWQRMLHDAYMMLHYLHLFTASIINKYNIPLKTIENHWKPSIFIYMLHIMKTIENPSSPATNSFTSPGRIAGKREDHRCGVLCPCTHAQWINRTRLYHPGGV